MPKLNNHSIKVFVRDAQHKRILCGRYETEVENYVLNVDVSERPFEVRSIEIEFLGKVQEDKEKTTADEFEQGWKHFLGCINFDKSNLDAEAIRFMNEVPGKIIEAIA